MLLRAAPLLIALALGVQQVGAQTEPDLVGIDTDNLVGSVLTSGRCPVPIGGIGRGQTCLDIPFQTTLVISSADTQQQVTSLPTATDGTFSIALPPGHYVVDPLLADGNPPYQSSIAIDISSDSITELKIRIDGGIAVRVP